MTPEERAIKMVDGIWQMPLPRDGQIDRPLVEFLKIHLEEACAEAATNAVAAHLASVVPEGPVSEEGLEGFRLILQSPDYNGLTREAAVTLLAAYDHLRSFCARLMNDSDAYQAGIEQGQLKMLKNHTQLLLSLEWCWESGMYGTTVCPSCRHSMQQGHNHNCQLAKLIKLVKEVTP